MRQLLCDITKLCSECFLIREPVYEFGSLRVKGQERFPDLRSYYPNKVYIGADIRHGNKVDMILDLHKLNLLNCLVGNVLLLDVLEHVEYPRLAMSEIYRVMKPDSILIMTSVMDFPIHNYPDDFWRFTPSGFCSLLQDFGSSYVTHFGKAKHPHTVFGIACKGKLYIAENMKFMDGMKLLKRKYYFRTSAKERLDRICRALAYKLKNI